jgi:hypothetical protein
MARGGLTELIVSHLSQGQPNPLVEARIARLGLVRFSSPSIPPPQDFRVSFSRDAENSMVCGKLASNKEF